MKKKGTLDPGAFITASIKTAKIKKSDIIAESGISKSSFYRAVSAASKVSKPNLVALVRAINKLAKKNVVDENEALEQSGFDAELQNPVTVQIDAGVQLIVEKSKFSKKQLSRLTDNLRSAYEVSLRSSAQDAKQPKKMKKKEKAVKKAAEKRRA
jgi:uncharacterized protein YihD (DUF1040 family)